MGDNTVYVVDNGDDGVEIMEDGFITHENITTMKFTFAPGLDITESLNKKSSKSRKNISVTKNGRTGYSPATCTYPDGTSTSSKVVLTDCIIQYRLGVDKEESDYARGYVCIGIPVDYIDKIRKDAKINSSMTLGVKSKVQRIEGCYWLECTLDNLSSMDTWIIFQDDSGDDTGRNGTVFDILKGMKSSLVVDIMTSISATITTEKMDEELDLVDGKYTITMKPTEVYIRDTSKKIGPVLEDTNKRRKEGVNKTERFKASAQLAEFAMRNLSI